MSAYPFIEAEKAESRNVAKACELMEVSRSAFYDWQRHQPSRREIDDQILGERIAEIHKKSRGVYGCPRVHAQLRRDGYHVARKRVARIMAAPGPGRALQASMEAHHHRRSRSPGRGRSDQAGVRARDRRGRPGLCR